MEYISIRDLRTTPSQVWQTLSAEGEVVVTNNGRPQALMIQVDAQTLGDTLAAVRQANAQRSLVRLQADSIAAGLDAMTMDEIDAEIAAARTERPMPLESKSINFPSAILHATDGFLFFSPRGKGR
jgi:antitoxin (DNA-binding transcriptional repressor) of toxin-antitoxin stability system